MISSWRGSLSSTWPLEVDSALLTFGGATDAFPFATEEKFVAPDGTGAAAMLDEFHMNYELKQDINNKPMVDD